MTVASRRLIDESLTPPSQIALTLRAVGGLTTAEIASRGLDLLGAVDRDQRLAGRHRLAAVREHLLELTGEVAAAAAAYDVAARLATSLPERQYLQRRGLAVRTRS